MPRERPLIPVSLTFDDGLDSHLDRAIPLLERHGLRGTFYVHLASDCFLRRAAEWGAAASRGHELGNHTLFHPATRSKAWVREGNAIEGYSVDRMRLEIEVASRLLAILDGRKERSFAYPCGSTVVGRPGWLRRLLRTIRLERRLPPGWIDRFDLGGSLADYTHVVRGLFAAARGGAVPDEGPSPGLPDRHLVPSISGDGRTAPDLLRALERSLAAGSWAVFSWHGIGGDHGLSCDPSELESFIGRVATDPRVVVKPFVEVAKELWR